MKENIAIFLVGGLIAFGALSIIIYAMHAATFQKGYLEACEDFRAGHLKADFDDSKGIWIYKGK